MYIETMFILYMHSDESGNNWTKSFKLEHIFETFENRGMFENSVIQLFES